MPDSADKQQPSIADKVSSFNFVVVFIREKTPKRNVLISQGSLTVNNSLNLYQILKERSYMMTCRPDNGMVYTCLKDKFLSTKLISENSTFLRLLNSCPNANIAVFIAAHDWTFHNYKKLDYQLKYFISATSLYVAVNEIHKRAICLIAVRELLEIRVLLKVETLLVNHASHVFLRIKVLRHQIIVYWVKTSQLIAHFSL